MVRLLSFHKCSACCLLVFVALFIVELSSVCLCVVSNVVFKFLTLVWGKLYGPGISLEKSKRSSPHLLGVEVDLDLTYRGWFR